MDSSNDELIVAERERCAKLLELSNQELLLLAGEMTANELLTVKAVLANRAKAIRTEPLSPSMAEKRVWSEQDVHKAKDMLLIGAPWIEIANSLNRSIVSVVARLNLCAAEGDSQVSEELNRRGLLDLSRVEVGGASTIPPWRSGKRWTQEEEQLMCAHLAEGKSISLLAQEHGRTLSAMLVRLIENADRHPDGIVAAQLSFLGLLTST